MGVFKITLPGGADGSIQYRAGGRFVGSSAFTFGIASGNGTLTVGNGTDVHGRFVVKNNADDLLTVDNTDDGTIRLNATGGHGQSLSIIARDPATGASGFRAAGIFGVILGATSSLNIAADSQGVTFQETLAEGGGGCIFIPKSPATTPITVRGLSGQTADLHKWENSGGTILTAIGAGGQLKTNQTAAATTPGTVVARLPIHDPAGVLVGYAALYDAVA